jgi:hypothetical protein
MAAKCSLQVSCLKLPNLYGAVLGAGRQGRILRMKGKSSNIGFMAFKLKFRWGDGDIHVVSVDVYWAFFDWSFRHLL